MEALIPLFDDLVGEIARDVLPRGWRACSGSPDTLEEVIRNFERTGDMIVTNSRPRTTVFGSFEKLIAFRAWHDWIHWKYVGEFTLPGELMVGHVHVGGLVEKLGFTREAQEMGALALIQVYQQNVYFFDTHELRVEDERRFALLYFSGWYEYAGRLMDHMKKRARVSPLTMDIGVSFHGELPTFCHTLDAKRGFRV